MHSRYNKKPLLSLSLLEDSRSQGFLRCEEYYTNAGRCNKKILEILRIFEEFGLHSFSWPPAIASEPMQWSNLWNTAEAQGVSDDLINRDKKEHVLAWVFAGSGEKDRAFY